MTADRLSFAHLETPRSSVRDSLRLDVLDEKPGAVYAGVRLEWCGVTVHKQVKSKTGSEERAPPALSFVNGFAAPGELLVVIGPQGAGKTTLLSVLSGRSSPALSSESSVTLNGQPLTKPSARCHIAFVPPNDLFHGTLTVREHLVFQARFHIEYTRHTEHERQHRVDHVLRENGLESVRDSLVGMLSAGLKKRLAIASELVGHASILLVDEPTTGLDNFTAVSIVSQLKHIASRGNTTAIAAITKLSSEVFAQFDKVLLLGAGGRVVYHGRAASAIAYFAERGHHCPTYFSAADFLTALVSVAPSLPSLPWEATYHDNSVDNARIEALAQAWETHRHSDSYSTSLLTYDCEASATIESGFEGDHELAKLPHASRIIHNSGFANTLYTLVTLAQRNVARISGNKAAMPMMILPHLIPSVLIGLIYLQPDMDQFGAQSISSVLFVFNVAQMMLNARGQFAGMPPDLAIALRQHHAGLYHVASWYLVKNVTELPQQTLPTVFFLLPAYFLIGLGHGVDLFFYLLVVLILVNSAAVGFGYMITCVARRTNAATLIGFAILIPMLILGGVLVNPAKVPKYWYWLEYVSPFKYGYEAVMNLYWRRVDSIACGSAAICSVKSGLQVLASRGLTERTPWDSGLLLVAVNVGFRLVGLLSLLFM